MRSPKSGQFMALMILAGALAANIIFIVRGWNAPLADRHEFRQTQTAVAARQIARDGMTLSTYIPVFGPPWDVPFECPFYQNIVGVIARASGLSVVTSGRLVSLAFFYGLLPALYLLARRLMTREGAWVFVALVLSSPTYLFWSRAVLIESLALSASVWGLWLLLRAIDRPTWGRILLASVVLSVAGLVKITTLFVWLLVAGVWWVALLRVALRNGARWADVLKRFVGGGGIPVIIAIAVALAWVGYGDHVKGQNPMAAFLISSSEAMKRWDFGSWTQFSPAHMERWLGFVGNVFGLRGGLVLVCFLAVAMARQHAVRIVLCGVLFLVPLLVFTNLYFVHDYYYYANGLLLLAAVAFVMEATLSDARFAIAGKVLLIAWVAYDQHRGGAYYRQCMQAGPAANPLAEQIHRRVGSDGVVVAYGFSWSPALAYYSDRKFLMADGGWTADSAAAVAVRKTLPENAVRAVVVSNGFRGRKDYIAAQLRILGLPATAVYTGAQGDLYVRP
jgi:hypothetical protein